MTSPQSQVLNLVASAHWVDSARDLPRFRQDQLWCCLDQLRKRIFTNGLRVKKLKGFPGRVWEARLDHGDRIVFTYGTEDTGRSVIQLWAVVPHDDVNRLRRKPF